MNLTSLTVVWCQTFRTPEVAMRPKIPTNILRTVALAATLVAVSGADVVAQEAKWDKLELKRLEHSHGRCYAKEITDVVIPMTGGQFEVVIPPKKVAYVEFPDEYKVKEGYFVHGGFKLKQVDSQIIITATSQLKHGDSANIVIKSGSLRTTMAMRVSKDLRQPASIIRVKPFATEDFKLHKRLYEEREAEKQRERDKRARRDYRLEMAKQLLAMRVLRPYSPRIATLGLYYHHLSPPGEIRAVVTRLLHLNSGRYLEVLIDNQTDKRFSTTQIYLDDDVGRPTRVTGKFDDRPAPGRGIAIEVSVAPRTKVRGIIVVPDGIKSALNAMQLEMRGLPGEPVVEIWPQMPEEWAREIRWAKQIALSVRLLGGGFWTGDGMDTPGVEDGTSLTGLGVRFSKGMHKNFVFEAEVVGGWTGQVRFRDADWDGMQGDITRSAAFGRVQGFGVLRFGERYVGSMRLGVGVQGTSYESSFTAGGGASMDGPGNEFEIDGLWSFGGGFEARLRENWSLGASATFAKFLSSDARTLEAGVQLGYRWNTIINPR